MRRSKELQKVEEQWIGQRIFFLIDALKRNITGEKNLMQGPFEGTVLGVSNNEAMITDRLEGLDGRNSVKSTGMLIVREESVAHDQYPYIEHCKILH